MNCLVGVSGLGDWWDYIIIQVKSSENAAYLAWCLACEQYESYIGTNGIRDVYTIMDEENCNEEEATETFQNEREMWIDYWISFDIENKIRELLDEGRIDSITEINNYEKLQL